MSERIMMYEKISVATKRAVGVLATATALWGFGIDTAANDAWAETGCYGSECTGKNPTGFCDSDAFTAATETITTDVGEVGQLDLRYSPRCKANWGRFTAFTLRPSIISGLTRNIIKAPVPLGRVTVWNPGQPSQGAVNNFDGSGDRSSDMRRAFRGVSWTKMVDGTKEACVGVEVSYENAPGEDWLWGPCR